MGLLEKLSGRNRGIALIMVLWVLTLLALIAASFSSTTRTEVNLARNIVESAKAEALAEAGVHEAILGLNGDSGEDPWRVDRTVYAWRFGGGGIRVAIEDEGAKIDLNAARDQILRQLFLALDLEDERTLELSEAEALVDAILDYRDPDDLIHHSGAEDNDYRSAGLKHDAKDAPFEAVEELQQVYGMTREIYQLVAPAVTVYARRRRPFTATASELVKAAMEGGLGDAAGREASPNLEIEDEEDDSDVISLEDLSDVPQIIEKGPSAARSRVPIYTIHAEGRSAGGAVFALDAVTRLTRDAEQPYIFLGWKRGARRLFDSAADEDELAFEE